MVRKPHMAWLLIEMKVDPDVRYAIPITTPICSIATDRGMNAYLPAGTDGRHAWQAINEKTLGFTDEFQDVLDWLRGKFPPQEELS